MTTLIIVTAMAVAAAGLAGYFRFVRREPAVPDVLVFRCGGCSQKLRYAVDRAGRAAQCPRCRKTTTLPEAQRAVKPGAVFIGARKRQPAGEAVG